MSRYLFLITAAVAGFLLSACASTVQSHSTLFKSSHSRHMQSINGEGMLIGEITRDELFSEFDIFKTNYEKYVPSDSAVQLLKNYTGAISIEIFLGTWCGDTKRNLPHFLKTLDQAKMPNVHVVLHGLDRTKTDKEKLTTKHGITRVPTMIFYRDGREIGRITEHPKASMEEDMLTILR